jgi:hypothetical protein
MINLTFVAKSITPPKRKLWRMAANRGISVGSHPNRYSFTFYCILAQPSSVADRFFTAFSTKKQQCAAEKDSAAHRSFCL